MREALSCSGGCAFYLNETILVFVMGACSFILEKRSLNRRSPMFVLRCPGPLAKPPRGCPHALPRFWYPRPHCVNGVKSLFPPSWCGPLFSPQSARAGLGAPSRCNYCCEIALAIGVVREMGIGCVYATYHSGHHLVALSYRLSHSHCFLFSFQLRINIRSKSYLIAL
jgi:hypothetical protein